MIEVKNLTKKYGQFTAVNDVNLQIEKGHIYGFLGPNGAGKSTTMNIITGCLAATDGTVTVNGADIYEDSVSAKKCIGYLPENPPLYMDMTPYEYLMFVGGAKGLKRAELAKAVESVMEKTGTTVVRNRIIKNLSKGYKQRVGIAQAILGNPDYVILDEPTVGLDPLQLIEIRELILSLKEEHGVILSSHIMGEVEAICDSITMIFNGVIIASDTYEGLERRFATLNTIKVKGDRYTVREVVRNAPGLSYSKVSENGRYIKIVYEVADKSSRFAADSLFNALTSAGCEILETNNEFNLEDCFIKLTSENAANDAKRYAKVKKARQPMPSPLGGAYLENEETTAAKSVTGTEETAETVEDTVEEEEYKPLFGESESESESESDEEATDNSNEKEEGGNE